MGRRVRELDSSATPLGLVAGWPRSPKDAVRLILNNWFPTFVWWGPELINLDNDAYSAVVGRRHPGALGRPAAEVWREIWDVVGPHSTDEASLRLYSVPLPCMRSGASTVRSR
jgi:hypothetical protein